ncbi:MAG: hypothetical protein ACOC02_01400 [Guyparkeria sp.]
MSGLPYGENQAVNAQASAAPMDGGSSGGGGGLAQGGGRGGPRLPQGGAFGPTAMPQQPMTAGVGRDFIVPPDPDVLIRGAAEASRALTPDGSIHPDLARLLTRIVQR